MTSNDFGGGYECIWSNLNEHPKCPHGPMLLFGRYADGVYKKFYACSACRDRKLCNYYMDYDTKRTKQQREIFEADKKRALPRYDRQKMFVRYNEMLAENPARRIYCHDCSRLCFVSEKHKHRGHDVSENLTDRQMSHPTEILKPLDNPKKEAQYLFSKESTEKIVDLLLSLGAKNVLCVGAPRIHEYLTNNCEDRVSSLLLDIDGRFHNFYGPLSFCWYNLFNHHFFHDDSNDVFKDFLTQNGGKNTYVVCDPPFGGRVEPMSQTLKTIKDLHKKLNRIDDDDDDVDGTKTMFIFPYFMERIMKEKSNPRGVEGGLRELRMCDYKVDYDNHPLFAKSLERKIGSQVRIFTDIDLSLIELPESEGYKYCKRCKKWVSRENKHCKKCKECTSKDGRRYRHCNACERCVKPTWKHCKKCDRCALENHRCGEAPLITGRCHKCNEFGHVENTCDANIGENITRSDSEPRNGKPLKSKKRKTDDGREYIDKKKARSERDDEPSLTTKKVEAKSEKINESIAPANKGMKFEESIELDAKSTDKKFQSKTIIESTEASENLVRGKSRKKIPARNSGADIVKNKRRTIASRTKQIASKKSLAKKS